MASLNKMTIIGNLGADPEVRYLDGGAVVATFNVATTEKYINRNGEKVEQTEWFRVELWNEQAKVAERFLKKGNPVYIEGRLRTEIWTDKEGKERTSLRVRANTMQLLGSPGDRQDDGATYEAPAQQAAPVQQSASDRPRQQAAPAPPSAPAQPAPAQAAPRQQAPTAAAPDRPRQSAAPAAQPARQPAARREPDPVFESNSGDDDLPF